MNNNKLYYLLMINFLCIMQSQSLSYAFEVNVHEKIAENAIKQNIINLDAYLKNVGLNSGVDEKVNGKEIRKWIQDGSRQEDEPIYALRYLKHFYEPISGSGLYGTILSSYQWANDGGNEWSWRAARSKYYTGLTATTDTERKSALADSFRSIGQVMHLVQDMASVAHTRNDAHGIYDGFEYYSKENIGSLNYSAATISIPTTSVTPYTLRQLWDSDTYDGTNPSGSDTIGLAEYTNANFFSGDTV